MVYFLLLMGFVLTIPGFVFAYSEKTTHPALTSEIVNLFNQNFPSHEISNGDKNLIVQGSIDEDNFARSLYHFYDPVYNRGLVFGGSWASSKEWATNHELQAKYDPKMTALAAVVKPFDASTDYSWERSIYEYAWGDKNRGLVGLGHILHLLEDATVPDHTRNDVHPPSIDISPYESWTSKFTISNLDLFSVVGSQKPIILSSIVDYFNTLANYSNNNFFSKDTIVNSGYSNPKLSEINFKDDYGYSPSGDYRIVYKERYKDTSGINVVIKERFLLFDPSFYVLRDYWSLLSKQAVLNGAGVVKLFFDEVEKEKKSKVLLAYNKSPAERAIGAIIRTFLSPVLRQANQEPEYWEDLDLPKPPPPPLNLSPQISGANIASFIEPVVEENKTDTINRTNNAPTETPTTTTTISPTPSAPSNTSPAMPIAGGGGAPPPESVVSPTPPPPSPSPPSPLDTEAPSLSFTITACDSSIAANGCLLYSGSALALSWSSTATDLADYSVSCTLSGATCSGYNLANIAYTSTTTNLSARGLYTLTFSARDTSNNTTSTSTQLEINPVPIIINEVAWMGATANTTHEWAELYNTSSYTINLGDGSAASWNLVAQDSTPSIYLNGALASGAYFVLERDASATSYSHNQLFTDAIDNPSGSDYLYLKNPAGTTLDYASASFAGQSSLPRKSMERINPLFNGDNVYNWRTYSGSGSTYTDSASNPIYGTPGSQNSTYNITNWQPTYVPDSTRISANTVWTLSGSPYILQSNLGANNMMAINSGSSLTIEPGAVVMAKSAFYPAMTINGALIAEGTPANNIVFTTLKDAVYGGTGSAVKGSWARIIFSSTAANSSLKYLKYRYGGFYSGASQPAIEVNSNAAVTFDNVTFEQSQGHVFALSGSGFTNLTIQNSIFQNNGDAPIKITSSSPNILANTVSSNTINGILITSDSNFTANTTWGSTIPYILESTGTARPTIAANAILTINPGVILKPQSSANESLRIDGVLNWSANAANPGIITSYKDDSYGGDTNGDGAAGAAAVGDWKQIRFTNTTSGSSLSSIKLRYGSSTDELLIDPGVAVNKANVVSEP